MVETSIISIGNTNIHIQYNVSEYINKRSFISVLWIYSCNELKWWQNYYFGTIIISNSQIEILVSYSRSTNVNVNIHFPNSQFEGNISTYVFGKSFWNNRELKSESCTSRHLLCGKIFNYSYCVDVRILVEKWNIYEGYIWTISLVQTCSWETITFCLCTRLSVHIFNVNQCQCKHAFPNSNFERIFSTYVFGKSFLHNRVQKNEYWTSRHL